MENDLEWCLIEYWFVSGGKSVYTSEKSGCDEKGDGSEEKPYKTAVQALKAAGEAPWPLIYVDAKEEGKVIN